MIYITGHIHSSEHSTFHLYHINFVHMAHITYYKVISLNLCCPWSKGILSFLKWKTEVYPEK